MGDRAAVTLCCKDAHMRIDPDPGGSELQLLGQYLDNQRETVLLKADGLSGEQLVQKLPPSDLTLGGLLYHLALVEETWMEVRFLGLSLIHISEPTRPY